MVKLDGDCLELAKEFLLSQGDSDLFPAPFEIKAIDKKWDMIKTELLSKDMNKNSYNWMGGRRSVIPKGTNSFRVGTQLDPIDSLVLTSIIYQYGNQIEKKRVPITENKVFSYRFKSNSSTIYNENINWNNFWEESIENAERIPDGFVLVVDVSDFYNQIYHHTLENELLEAKIPNEIVKLIISLLMKLTNGVSRGVPVGPHASHLLAEISVNPIDRSLKSHSYHHCRFVDDINLFCENEEKAKIALFDIVEILDKHGHLTLQKHKTFIMPSKDFIQYAQQKAEDVIVGDLENQILSVIKKYSSGNRYQTINYNSLSPTEKELFNSANLTQLFENYLTADDVDFARIRWLLRRLAQVGAPDAIPYLITNIKRLMPALEDLCSYIVTTENTYDGKWEDIGDSLIECLKLPLINHSEYLQMILVNLFSKISNLNHIEKLISLYGRSNTMLERKILIAATKANNKYWLKEKIEEINNVDPWKKRAIILGASTFSPDEKNYWLDRIIKDANSSILDKTVAYWVKEGGNI